MNRIGKENFIRNWKELNDFEEERVLRNPKLEKAILKLIGLSLGIYTIKVAIVQMLEQMRI